MPFENPTGGDAGASIVERLERHLAAQDDPADDQHSDDDQDGGSDDGAQEDDQDANADTNGTQADDAPGDDEGPQLTTSDFAKMLGIDESLLEVGDDGAVGFKTKIDGKDGTAKLADVLKSYQLQGHAENRVREAAEREKALQMQAQQADQAIRSKLDLLDQHVKTAAGQVLREFQAIDWNTLRAQDPGEYAALMADFQARQASIDRIAADAQKERDELDVKQKHNLQAFIAQEAQRLPTVIPEWSDVAVAQKDMRDMHVWAMANGFDPQEVEGIVRAPHLAAIRKAMLFDRMQSDKSVVENKVRTAPKLVKPGQAQQITRGQQEIRTLKQNVRNSGGKERDVAALLLARGFA